MNDLKSEILKLDLMAINSVFEILGRKGKARAFLAKNINTYGVAIENLNNIVVNEKFVNINLKNVEFLSGDQTIRAIYLYASKTVVLSNFIYLAENFLNLNNENKILENPYMWVDEWKDMLGDSIKKFRVYDVIGELLSFKHVYSNDKNAHWQASIMGVHDIESHSDCFEVKSTINRENTVITISSAFQLLSDKKEYLLFCRLEKDQTSKYSIDYLVDEIVNMGYSKNEIELELTNLGYTYGMKTRKQSYNILELRKYVVNKENFPVIDLAKINELSTRNNIIGFKITLDLSGIEYEKII